MIVYQHKALAAGRWQQFSLAEQMAHVGSEVERAKGYPRLRELARVREALVDDFFGTNEYRSTDALWRRYFGAFTWLARKDH